MTARSLVRLTNRFPSGGKGYYDLRHFPFTALANRELCQWDMNHRKSGQNSIGSEKDAARNRNPDLQILYHERVNSPHGAVHGVAGVFQFVAISHAGKLLAHNFRYVLG